MLILILAVLTVLISSAICSGSEAALFSVPLIKVRQTAETKKASALALLAIREDMNRPIAAIVVLNNIANIVGSILVGGVATAVLGSQWLGLFSGLLTFLVIVFSEIIPKTLGERHSERISLWVARPTIGITRILTPLLWFIEKITLPVTRGSARGFTTNEAEIKLLAKIGQQEGAIDRRESDLVRRAFKLDKTTAKDLMTPRVAMTCLKGELTLGSAREEIIHSQHSRMIVVGETPDKVVGVALKDELLTALIQNNADVAISELAHEVQLVAESESADRLLSIFQESRRHLAVVVDEYLGVSGIVTLEDVLEVLTGEIVDETDKAVDLQAEARRVPARGQTASPNP